MRRFLAVTATLVERRPRATLLALLVATLVLGALATQQRTDTELTAFAPDSELAADFDRVREDFAAGGARIQVLVDAGPGGDVLSPLGLAAAQRVEEVARRAPLAEGERGVASYALPIVLTLEATGQDGEDPAVVDALAAELLGGPAAAVAPLLSEDLDVASSSARAGLVVLELDPRLPDDAAAEAALTFAADLEAVAFDGVAVAPFSSAILADAMQQEMATEMPRLLGLSMLLIAGILFLQHRRASDVILGMAGLVVTITWMFGISVLLGPDFLGLVGPFTQVSTVVPVLLIGLGIDYAIHLTSRYREERRYGLAPPVASAMAVRTVGGALVLATMTTMVGFLTNVFSPLPPMADFGVFTAVGVLSAFVVMAGLIPAARRLLDTRPRALARTERRGTGGVGPAGVLAELMGRTAVLAERAPRAVLVGALVLTLSAAGLGTRIETSFSQADFVPEGSPSAELLAAMEDLFGGDVSELTYVLVDGDLTDPELVSALASAPASLAEVRDVRGSDGAAEVTSPAGVLAELAAEDPAFAAQAQPLGLAPDGAIGPDADVAGLYDLARAVAPARIGSVLAPDATTGLLVVTTSAGQDRADALAAGIQAGTAPIRDAGASTAVVSETLVMDETMGALTDSQARGIIITLLGALALLVSFYGFVERRPLLGVIAMVPSAAVVGWVLGTMVLLGISFNVMTAMVASLAIGIGVPFGIHITHRFLEDRRRYDTIDEAIRQTVTHTGGAMAGSAATTAAGFGVLAFASLVPMQQFGIIVAITIVYSLLASVLIQPSCLKLWGEWRARRGEVASLHAHEDRDVLEPAV